MKIATNRLSGLFTPKQRGNRKQRLGWIERLERRDMLAAAVWNNVIDPVNVNGDEGGFVSPIDALLVINEVNKRIVSDPISGALPRQVPMPLDGPFFDVSCDNFVTPLDALIVINHINNSTDPGPHFHSGSGTYASVACSPQLVEGSSFATELSRVLTIPDATTAIEVRFQAPDFDTASRRTIRDAFEIEISDLDGNPVALPYMFGREAFYNWSEELEPVFGPGTSTTTVPADQDSTATVNLSGLATGTKVRVTTRLVNNDLDDQTSVIIRGFELVDAPLPPPAGIQPSAEPISGGERIDFSNLTDVSASVVGSYLRTTLVGQDEAVANGQEADSFSTLYADALLANEGTFEVYTPVLLVIDNVSEPSVAPMDFDGRTPDGLPFFDLSSLIDGTGLEPGEFTSSRSLAFLNPDDVRFSFKPTVYAALNQSPRFESQPIESAIVGREYSYRPVVSDKEGDELSFELSVAPAGMSIDAVSGHITWTPAMADVGGHSVRIRVDDDRGGMNEQQYSLEVRAEIPNRPPIIVSAAEVDAGVSTIFQLEKVAVGSGPVAALLDDFNGNGQRTLVTANPGSQTVSLVPTADGLTFDPAEELGIGEPPPEVTRSLVEGLSTVEIGFSDLNRNEQVLGLARGDFNRDGLLDVAAVFREFVGSHLGHVSISLGQGNGTFGSPLILDLPSLGAGILAGNFDQDGIPDLVVAATTARQLVFFKGLGDGTFAPAVTSDLSDQPEDLQAADLNGDDVLDLAITQVSQRTVSILFGAGDGTFVGEVVYDTINPFTQLDLVLADLDGVRGPDLITAGNGGAGRLEVWLNDGSGTMAAPIEIPTPNPSSGAGNGGVNVVYAGEFNGDGFVDLVYHRNSSPLGLLKGNGDGTFAGAAPATDQELGTSAIQSNVEQVASDLNGDGHLDFLFGNRTGSNVMTVVLGAGDGTFRTLQYLASPGSGIPDAADRLEAAPPIGILPGDFNNDGVSDLSVLVQGDGNNRSGSVSLMLGQASGEFLSPRLFMPSRFMSSIGHALADFNNDGLADLAQITGAVDVSLGLGDGTFGEPFIAVTEQLSGRQLRPADFDQDGNIDLVWNASLVGGGGDRYLVAHGLGDGTFTVSHVLAPPLARFGRQSNNISVVDFNGDGLPDFAVRVWLIVEDQADIEIWLNDPLNNTFTYVPDAGQQFLMHSVDDTIGHERGSNLVTGDFDGDGIADLIAQGGPEFNDVSNPDDDLLEEFRFYKGKAVANGTVAADVTELFEPPQIVHTNLEIVNNFSAADLDRDGDLDLVAASEGRNDLAGKASTQVLLNQGDGTFDEPQVYFAGNEDVAISDINGDGILDLGVLRNYSLFTRHQLATLTGRGDGTFNPPEIFALAGPFGATDIDAADLDGDTQPDLVVTQGSGSSTVPNSSMVFLTSKPGLAAVASGDLNGDGFVDVIAANEANGHLKWLAGHGDNTFTRQQDLLVGRGPAALASVDLDCDLDLEVITANRYEDSVTILLNDGGGSFTRADLPVGDLPSDLAIADLTGDGQPDIIVTNEAEDTISLLVNEGVGNFAAAVELLAGGAPVAVVLEDATGDGRRDIVIANDRSRTVTILPGNDDGTFGTRLDLAVSDAPADVAVGDVNLDGLPDLVTAHTADSKLQLFLGQGDGQFADPQTILLDSGPVSVTLDDVDGDGRLDFVASTPNEDAVTIVYNRVSTSQYRYQIEAVDPDVDPLSYSMLLGPGGMLIDPVTGVVTWQAAKGQLGPNNVTVEVADGRGGTATQSFVIEVTTGPDNSAPHIISTPSIESAALNPYHYQVRSLDADGDQLRYSLENAPPGMSIDGQTGLIEWNQHGPGRGLSFDGVDDIVEIPASDSLRLNHQATVSAWVQFPRAPSDGSGRQQLVGNSSGSDQLALMAFNNNRFAFQAGVGSQAFGAFIESTTLIQPGQWYHVAGTFTAFDQLELYVNGVLEASLEIPTIGRTYADLPFGIGGSQLPAFSDRFLRGTLNDVRVYDVARTPEEIEAEFMRTASLDPRGLVGFWTFTEETGDTVQDHSPFGNDGTLQGAEGSLPQRVSTPLMLEPGAGLGAHLVTVQVEDAYGATDLQTYTLNVNDIALGEILGGKYADLTGSGLPGAMFTTTVPGFADPWLAGMPDGTTDYGDGVATTIAPDQSPIEFVGLPLEPDAWLSFAASGNAATAGGAVDGAPADGERFTVDRFQFASHQGGERYGIANVFAPLSSLVGVFLGPEQPDASPAPETLDFQDSGNVPGGVNYLTLDPELKQVFFIGDGLTRDGQLQQIRVPSGATRLFVGILESSSWGDNQGSFDMAARGVDGWVVYVDDNQNGVRDLSEQFTTTDGDGRYRLGGLLPGEYRVAEEGQPSWAPTRPDEGFATVTVAAGATVELDWINTQVNVTTDKRPPQFTSTAPIDAFTERLYRYNTTVRNLDGRELEFDLPVAPDGMHIDPQAGVVIWTPGESQSGEHRIIMRVRDRNDHGQVGMQDFTVNVQRTNTAPVITSAPALQAVSALPYEYRVRAQDAEADVLVFQLDAAPGGMTIDAASGRIAWTPTGTDVGNHTVTVTVTDTDGTSDNQNYELSVVTAAPNIAPVITSTPRTQIGLAQTYFYRVEVDHPDADPLAISLVTAPAGMSIDAGHLIRWKPAAGQIGANNVLLRVDDSRGGVVEQSFTIAVTHQPFNQPPVILSAANTAATRDQLYRYDPEVQDPDGDPLDFALETAPAGMSIDVTSGKIRWLPQIDQLGAHDVLLRVTDALGLEATEEFTVVVRGANVPPIITSVPPTEAAVGETYLYRLAARDLEGDPLGFVLNTAPTGMIIDAASGQISWTPAALQEGGHDVTVQVDDGSGGMATQTWRIVVGMGLPNLPPTISSIPPRGATAGVEYTYQIDADDPEGSLLGFDVLSGPVGLTVDNASGLVRWTPTAGQAGQASVTLAVYDGAGGLALQSYTIQVQAANTPPIIHSAAPTSVAAGATYRYDVIAEDPEGDALLYSLVTAPAGMTIDQRGRISWPTAASDLGSTAVEVLVSDLGGKSTPHSFTIDVVADVIGPRVTILMRRTIVHTGRDIPIRVSASDNVAVTSLELSFLGVAIPLDERGNTFLQFAQPGDFELVATARDAVGNVGTTTLPIRVLPGSIIDDATAPFAEITTPAPDGIVTAPSDIIGTVTDDDLRNWTLSWSPFGTEDFTEIGTGTTEIVNGVLGHFDPTLLPNDAYVLRLDAVDATGQVRRVEQNFGVSGNLKLGNFRLSFTDLTIPVSGIPIQIVRTYDTLRADRVGDFGYGWRLEYRDTDLRVGLPKSGLEDIGIYTAMRPGVKVYLTLPGQERMGWTFTPRIRVLPGFGDNLVLASPRFTPDPGNTATLSAGGGQLFVNESGELHASGNIPWNPSSPDFGGGYTVTTKYGVRYFIDGNTGKLNHVTDRNDNRLSYGDSGVVSSSGKEVAFERDGSGRFTAVSDPSGDRILYKYNAVGELASVIDREGNETTFTYLSQPVHYLEKVTDPLGREGIRSEYGSDGRVIGMIDIGGQRTSISYDPENQIQFVQDVLGATTAYEYDLLGNVITVTDALGQAYAMTYDAAGNLLTQTDPLGHRIAYQYDDSRNIVAEVDALGQATQTTYSRLGNVLSVTNPAGDTLRNTYDDRGNLLSTTDPLGRTTGYSRDARGNVTSAINPVGNTTTATYTAAGNLSTLVDAEGSLLSLTYDADGQILSQQTSGQNYRIDHDRNGRITAIGVDGFDGHIAYDASGNVIGAEQASSTQVNYDSSNRVAGLTLANGTVSLSFTYDAMGNLLTETDALGNVTRHEYDAVGRLIKTIYPNSSLEQYEYDANGQVIAATDVRGNVVRHDYDPLGRRISTTDPLGRISKRQYDAVGNVIEELDPAGHATRYTYDASGLLLSTTYADGTQVGYEYDEMGRQIKRIDEAGNAFSYEYDKAGRLVSVVDAMGGRTHYEYTSGGQRQATIDASGNRTEYAYNEFDWLIRTTYANGDVETRAHDLEGFLTSEDNGVGTISYAYDIRGQLQETETSSGFVEAFTYTVDGLLETVVDGRGTTTIEYDPLQRWPTRVTEPDGRYVRYEYDASGNRTLMAHAMGEGIMEEVTGYYYDASNQLTIIADSTGGSYTFAYDLNGQIDNITRPNGTSASYAYDVRGRLLQIHEFDNAGSVQQSWTYTLDAVGNRLREELANGSFVEYEYDDLYRVVAERHWNNSGGETGFATYSYDSVGNLVARTGFLGEATFTYNAVNQLVSGDGLSYTYDAAGNLSTVVAAGGETTQYSFDVRGRLESIASSSAEQIEYVYDWEGNRIAEVSASGRREFLVDRYDPSGLPQVVRESTGEGDSVRSFVHAGGPLQSRDSTGRLYYHRDALGSVRIVTDDLGNVRASHDYSAYGLVLPGSNEPDSFFGFAGEQWDSVGGVYYLRARVYEPASGRFLGRDPFAGDESVPMSLHKYLYSHGNPVNLTDPSGLTTLSELMVTLAGKTELARQRVHKFLRAKDKLAEGLGHLSTALGGAMIVSIALNPKMLAYSGAVFFGTGFIKGVTNTFHIGLDMLGGKNPDFNITYPPPSDLGAAARYDRQFTEYNQKARGKKYAHFSLFPAFLYVGAGGILRPLIPDDNVYGTPSMAGIMIHEFAHATLGISIPTGLTGEVYGCGQIQIFNPNLGISGALTNGRIKSAAQALTNADNFRCFVRAASSINTQSLQNLLT